MDYISLTRAFGITTLIISLGFLFHLKHYEAMAKKMVGEPSGFIMGGILPVLVGSLVIQFPHTSYHGWSTLDLIGWILFLVGIFRIWFVHLWIKIIKQNITLVPILFAVFGLIFGCLLCYSGFVAPMYHLAWLYPIN